LLLLVDGLKQLPSEAARRDLKALRQNYQKTTPMIFTTRDLGVGSALDIAKKLEMQPLTEAQMQQFVQAYLPPMQSERMLRQLGNPTGKQSPTEEPVLKEGFPPQATGVGNPPKVVSHRLREFGQAPLLLWMLCSFTQAKDQRVISPIQRISIPLMHILQLSDLHFAIPATLCPLQHLL